MRAPLRIDEVELDLAFARMLARRAHTLKHGQHVIRVAAKAHALGTETETLAWLHDLVGETWLTTAHLAQLGFADRVNRALHVISPIEAEGSDAYFERLAGSGNRLAIQVKLICLRDAWAQSADEAVRTGLRRAIRSLSKAAA